MKLVVCYSSGAYDSFECHNICIEYISKEAFLEKFKEAFETWNKFDKEWLDLCYDETPISQQLRREDMKEFMKKNAKHRYNMFVDNVFEFPIPDNDIIRCEFNHKKLVSLPNVYTLEEWFELNKAKESFTSS